MKKHLIIAVMLLTVAACSQTQKENEDNVSEATASETIVFNEQNIPVDGLDVTPYSTGIQHVGLPTTNVQATIDFYKGLGFTLATRHDIAGRDFAFMQLGNLLIEVIPTNEPAMVNGAVDHFCLDVQHIDELFAQLQAAGYTMLNDSVNDIAFWQHGARYFFIQGPNNEKIEFCEVVK